VVKFAIGVYKSEVCLVLILFSCELDINWSYFWQQIKVLKAYIGIGLAGYLIP
jgi:hypothetical protein